jgi:D-proline reductase (dithiol) PrdB
MPVNSDRWLPYGLAAWIKESWKIPHERAVTPFQMLNKKVSDTRLALLTTGGMYLKGVQEPFDILRESEEPTWGDPTYRVIPRDVHLQDIGVAHHHYNPEDAEGDMNILLPIHRFIELEAQNRIGSLASNHYSVMGYQGHPGPNWAQWIERTGPMILAQMKSEGVDGVLLTPA